MTYDQRDDVILPQYVLEQFSKLAKGEFIMTTGVGQHQMWAAQWTRLKHPRTWITSGGLGSMGYGLPAAMGAQAAFPDALVVDIDGDGSFLMNIQELATVYCENLPVKVHRPQQPASGHGRAVGRPVLRQQPGPHLPRARFTTPRRSARATADLPESIYPNFVEIARGFGVKARQIRKKDEVVDALAEMIAHPGPVRARRPGSLPGARPADDSRRHDRARHHQEIEAPGQFTQTGSSIRRLYFFIFL